MKLMVKMGMYIVLNKIYEIQEILFAERDKRNALSTNYIKGINVISVIDHCLGIAAIGLGITEVDLLSTIVAAPALIGMEQYQLLWVYFEL